jgi:uncharacterized protein YchJ
MEGDNQVRQVFIFVVMNVVELYLISICWRCQTFIHKTRTNMYDNFDLPRCKIVNEIYEEGDQKAEVTFIAELVLRESGEVTSFMETSTLERAKTHGGWLYLNGTIEELPEELVAGLKKASRED